MLITKDIVDNTLNKLVMVAVTALESGDNVGSQILMDAAEILDVLYEKFDWEATPELDSRIIAEEKD